MNDRERMAKFDIGDVTHELSCRHQLCANGWDYEMPCIILGKTKSGKLKLLVFGDRYWPGRFNRKQIRYVDPHRVSKFVGPLRGI